MASADGQRFWAQTSALSANRNIPINAYTDPLTREAAKILNESEIIVFDASDMMPAAMNEAFWTGIVSYVSEPASLERVLADLERVRADAYR